mmetsp:Transcript_28021/g.47614  ORF Transcript_28021/g.47614 Transcript_28021/m.47614 type:complete len:222 (-) Transcript_28021:856-1521(-)
MITTSPHLISLFSSPRSISCSLSYTLAVPVKVSPSFPVILATPPPGHRFPYIICKWPVGLMGSLRGLIISCPGVKPGWFISAKFSLCVFPVTVIWSPSKRSLSIKNLIIPGVPPMFWTSSMTNLPDGFKSARNGVTSERRWKSSNEIATSGFWHERLIAIKWRTAFVEPPVIITMRIAFSKAALVMISRGLMSFSSKIFIAAPALSHSSSFSSESAGELEE